MCARMCVKFTCLPGFAADKKNVSLSLFCEGGEQETRDGHQTHADSATGEESSRDAAGLWKARKGEAVGASDAWDSSASRSWQEQMGRRFVQEDLAWV